MTPTVGLFSHHTALESQMGAASSSHRYDLESTRIYLASLGPARPYARNSPD
jgi:hypothetical protein